MNDDISENPKYEICYFDYTDEFSLTSAILRSLELAIVMAIVLASKDIRSVILER